MTRVRFRAEIWRIPGKGGWHFVEVPERCAPSYRLAWGRSPVQATVNGVSWTTSVWREASGRVLLPLPRAVRHGLAPGDRVSVLLAYA